MARWSEWLMIGQSSFLNDKAYWVVSLCIHCSISSIDSFKVSIGSFKTGVAQRPILAWWLVWVNAQNRIGTAVACILVSMTAVACVLVQIRLNGRYWLGGQGQCSKWDRGHGLVQICMLRSSQSGAYNGVYAVFKMTSFEKWHVYGHDKGRPLFMSMWGYLEMYWCFDDYQIDLDMTLKRVMGTAVVSTGWYAAAMVDCTVHDRIVTTYCRVESRSTDQWIMINIYDTEHDIAVVVGVWQLAILI